MKIIIKEHSLVARLVTYILHEDSVAVVIGKTIHLWNTSRQDFLKNKRWLHHELVHIQQFTHHGFINFLFLYLFESLKNGYYNNKFELEAREKENDQIPVIKGIFR